jgi:hypothetical protein
MSLRGLIEYIAPIFVGDKLADGTHGPYFAGGCEPACAPVVVASVEAELAEQLSRTGLGTPLQTAMRVDALWQAVTSGRQCAGFIEVSR